jgi:hypothetical protein
LFCQLHKTYPKKTTCCCTNTFFQDLITRQIVMGHIYKQNKYFAPGSLPCFCIFTINQKKNLNFAAKCCLSTCTKQRLTAAIKI